MPVDVVVPPLGGTVDTLILIAWYKQEGDRIEKDEPLFAVETDKATLDVEAPSSGILSRVSATPGDEIVTLSRIAVILLPGESAASISPDGDAPRSSASKAVTRAEPVPAERRDAQQIGRIFVSPRAKRLADERAIEWRALCGTGPEGAIVERDVLLALDLLPAQDGDTLKVVPMSGARAIIAARMAQSSAETAAVTLTTEVDATELVERRRNLAGEGVAVSYNDLLLLLVSRALREHPGLNASLDGNSIRYMRCVNIGLAVDSESGLRVPVIRDADRRSLAEIAAETARLIESVRTGRIRPDEMAGATFTVTNLGMFGIDAFTPVINMPECAILGVGRIKPQPSVIGGEIVIRQKMWLSLTFDHRIVDGGPAARFLQTLTHTIETVLRDGQED